jgi:cell wall-associated NlpC family hydrolase
LLLVVVNSVVAPAHKAYISGVATLTAREIYRAARTAGFSPDQATTMTAIALAESGGRSEAHNSRGEDSVGLFQINRNAHPWAHSMDLTEPVVNARAAYRISEQGTTIAPWTTTHRGDQARYLEYRGEAQAAARSEGDGAGLGVWSGTTGYGVDVAAGDASGGGGAGRFDAPTESAAPTPADAALRVFLDSALAQTGDVYVFGAEASLADANPEVFDCSELVQWAAHRAGVEMPDGSWNQYLTLEQQGGDITVEQALSTPGALLFSFSSPPSAGSGRPAQAHVAISLGDGRTIEARGSDYGVGSWEANADRFQYAAVIPALAGASPMSPDSSELADDGALEPGSDVDRDGLTAKLEAMLATDPRLADTDDDGITDGYELSVTRTSPTRSDTDGDGVPDAIELTIGKDPLVADAGTAGDATLTGELDRLITPRPPGKTADSDGDGFDDWQETQFGTDPLDLADNPLAETPDNQANALTTETTLSTDQGIESAT